VQIACFFGVFEMVAKGDEQYSPARIAGNKRDKIPSL
jgi:hypothetical protein